MIGLTAVERVAGLAASVVFGGFLALVLMPYFMISAPRLSAGAIWLLPPERRRSVEDLLPKIVPVLRRHLIGICVVVFYTAVVAWIGFGPVFHLPNAVLLALTVGVSRAHSGDRSVRFSDDRWPRRNPTERRRGSGLPVRIRHRAVGVVCDVSTRCSQRS